MHALLRQLGAADDRRLFSAASRAAAAAGGGSVRPYPHRTRLSRAGTALDAATTPTGHVHAHTSNGFGGVAAAHMSTRASVDDTAATCSSTRYSHAGGHTTCTSSTGEAAFSRFSRFTDSGWNVVGAAPTVPSGTAGGGGTGTAGGGGGTGVDAVGLVGVPRTTFDTLTGALAVLLAPSPMLFPPASSAVQGEVFLPHVTSCHPLALHEVSGCWPAGPAAASTPAALTALLPLPPAAQQLEPFSFGASGGASHSVPLLPPRMAASRASASGACPSGAHEALLAAAALPDAGACRPPPLLPPMSTSTAGYAAGLASAAGAMATTSCSPLPSGVLSIQPTSAVLPADHLPHLMTAAQELVDRALGGGGSTGGAGAGSSGAVVVEGSRAGNAGVPLVRFGSTSLGLRASTGAVPCSGTGGGGAVTPSHAGNGALGKPPGRRVSGSLIVLDGMPRMGGFGGSVDSFNMSPAPAASQRNTPAMAAAAAATATAAAANAAAAAPAPSAGGAVGSSWKGLLNLLGVAAGGAEGRTGGGGSRRASTGVLGVVGGSATSTSARAAEVPIPTAATTTTLSASTAATAVMSRSQHSTGPAAAATVAVSCGAQGNLQPQALCAAMGDGAAMSGAAASPFSSSLQPLVQGQRPSSQPQSFQQQQQQQQQQQGSQQQRQLTQAGLAARLSGGGRTLLQPPADLQMPPPPILEEVGKAQTC